MSRITTERGLQTAMHDVVHRPPRSIAWKEEDKNISGTPDHTYCVDGFVSRVELKYVPEEKISKTLRTFLVGIRPGQYAKLREWGRAGGNAWLLVGVKDMLYLVKWDMMPEPKQRVRMTDLHTVAEWVGPCTRDAMRDMYESWLTHRPRVRVLASGGEAVY